MFSLLQNFVGLSVSDGYIATGSEANEVLHISTHLVFIRKMIFDTYCFFGFLTLLLGHFLKKPIPHF